MPRNPTTLAAIAQALHSQCLRDIAVGYVCANAHRDDERYGMLADYLKEMLLAAAAKQRSADSWVNEVDSVMHAIMGECGTNQLPKPEGESLVSTLKLLVPFARQTSLVVAADILSKKCDEVQTSSLFEGEEATIGAQLLELSDLAVSQGNLELASRFAERAVPYLFGKRAISAARLADKLDDQNHQRSSVQLGGGHWAPTLKQMVADVLRGSTAEIHR